MELVREGLGYFGTCSTGVSPYYWDSNAAGRRKAIGQMDQYQIK
jgi:hypothetical protein